MLRTEAQWLSGSVSRFHTTGPGSIPGLGKVDSTFHPYCSGSINEYQACLGTQTLGSRFRLTTGSGHLLMHLSAQWSRILEWTHFGRNPSLSNDHRAPWRFFVGLFLEPRHNKMSSSPLPSIFFTVVVREKVIIDEINRLSHVLRDNHHRFRLRMGLGEGEVKNEKQNHQYGYRVGRQMVKIVCVLILVVIFILEDEIWF
ncbi:hypothetical protein TNCV_1870811 [Trichonephila clavipes]|nr:hypothetical protein TNCV_1870811 [Trichonephila clavipes]